MTTLALDDLTVAPPPPSLADWNDEGVVVLPGLLDDEVIDAYSAEWLVHSPGPGGWPDCLPYRRYPKLLALVCDVRLAVVLEALLGEPAGVHLNLTGWVTTTRDWHQDSYLNPPHVGDYYAAAWVALDDIDPDSGPFQYVPGSHRWPQVTRDLIGRHVDLTDPEWPRQSEAILTPLFAREIDRRNAWVVTYTPKRGDVLVWHGRLLHRGSIAAVPGMERRALIAHYSGIHHRSDMPPAVLTEHGGWQFPIG